MDAGGGGGTWKIGTGTEVLAFGTTFDIMPSCFPVSLWF